MRGILEANEEFLMHSVHSVHCLVVDRLAVFCLFVSSIACYSLFLREYYGIIAVVQ